MGITDSFLNKIEKKTNVSKESILDIASRLKDGNLKEGLDAGLDIVIGALKVPTTAKTLLKSGKSLILDQVFEDELKTVMTKQKNTISRINKKCINCCFYHYSIIAILLVVFSILTFCRTKSNKSSASEYNASLLADCKRAQPTLLKKAQHRQNQSYRPFAHEFSRAKISFGWALLAGNFSHRKTTRECASLDAPRRAKKTFTLLSAP